MTLAATAALAGAGAGPSVLTEANLWSANYWAMKRRDNRNIWLAMYRKRRGAPEPGEPARPVLFLVHGSSSGAKASFDLSVPGHGEYSTMNIFAGAGFDVWTMDHEGYGQSSRTEGNADIASGVEDLKAAVDVVAHETGLARCSFMGESSGAIRAGAFAVAAPDRVDRLLLAAFTYTGKGSPTLTKRAEGLEYYRTHNRRPRDRAMIESIFTRDRPGTTDPAVPAAMADAELSTATRFPPAPIST
jgi:pimeloyl-ACP methyl ester carboxylesterase